jgi:hypothetical protein
LLPTLRYLCYLHYYSGCRAVCLSIEHTLTCTDPYLTSASDTVSYLSSVSDRYCVLPYSASDTVYCVFRMSTTINSTIDVLVPVYTLVVIGVLTLFYMHPRRANGLVYEYAPIKSLNEKDDDKDWRDKLEGYWNQADFDALDTWLVFCRRTFPVRMFAPTFMRDINNYIAFMDNYTKMHFKRDFSQGPTTFDAVLTLGSSEFMAIYDDASKSTINMRAHLDDDKKTLVMEMISIGSPDTISTRRLTDDNTTENVREEEYSVVFLFLCYIYNIRPWYSL